ncbi:hypothetical protein FMK97_17530 [Klebsiella variicola]|nr:hypothetical protein [Klebsiella variicola]
MQRIPLLCIFTQRSRRPDIHPITFPTGFLPLQTVARRPPSSFTLITVMKYKFYSRILWRKNVICVVFFDLH